MTSELYNSIACEALGLYVVACSIWTWRTKSSHFATSSVLDLISLFTRLLGKRRGAIVDAMILFVVGTSLSFTPILLWVLDHRSN